MGKTYVPADIFATRLVVEGEVPEGHVLIIENVEKPEQVPPIREEPVSTGVLSGVAGGFGGQAPRPADSIREERIQLAEKDANDRAAGLDRNQLVKTAQTKGTYLHFHEIPHCNDKVIWNLKFYDVLQKDDRHIWLQEERGGAETKHQYSVEGAKKQPKAADYLQESLF